MSAERRPTVRKMVKEAVEALGGDTTNTAVRDWILRKYPGTNKSTIQCHIVLCSVNHPSRVYYGQNKPRIASDERYDFLFRPDKGRVLLYDPSKHGVWKIVRHEDGALGVAREGRPRAAEVEEEVAETVGAGEPTVGFQAEDQLRDYLALNLEAIEEGLQLYVDEYGNAGVEYATPVGRVDLLGEDGGGGLVVIELKVGRSPDAAVGQVLRYMGWVKRHLAEGRPVRGVIVAQHAPDRLRYAVADLPDVSVMEYELSVTMRPAPGLDEEGQRV